MLLDVDFHAREGLDVQSFNGTSTSVNSPPTHFLGGLEGYLQYDSTNSASGSTGPVGSIFLGGSYGYSYTSHGYARQYGLGNQVGNPLAQVSVGILISKVVRIAGSRGFGPKQTYIDSTSMNQVSVDNFKSWSFNIAYQSTASQK